jgi:hypothetical protein
VVLAGGGGLAPYQVGVLKVLQQVGLCPAVLAGTSAGAINAVAWLAHGFRTEALERTWRQVRASIIGMRWTTLALRGGGELVALLAVLQVLFTLLGAPELAIARRLWRRTPGGEESLSALLDALAWALVAVLGAAAARLSRPAEDWMTRLHRGREPGRVSRLLGRALIALAALHVCAWGLGFPWPHRFSATVLVLGALGWFLSRPGRIGEAGRTLFLRLMPETRGRGLWRGGGRRRLLADLVAAGEPARLVGGDTLLVLTALAVDTGRIAHFVSGPAPPPAFRDRIERALGEVVLLEQPADVMDAVMASSAIPLAFEPMRVQGREFVDGGQFSNQPLAAVQAAEADAVLVVLLAPVAEPPYARREDNLIELGARLFELASWRGLQLELREIPADWRRAPSPDGPAHVCVVAPAAPLPGGLLAYDPRIASALIEMGERDGWKALAEAGWVEAPGLAN